MDEKAQIKILAAQSVDIQYTDIQGLDQLNATGNIGDDPQFVKPEAGLFCLRATSPCIDAADTLATPLDDLNVDDDALSGACITNMCDGGERTPDLALNDRVIDDPLTFNTGVPENDDCLHCGEFVDMGCLEFVESPCGSGACLRGDLNGDTLRDGRDIQPFVACVLATDLICKCPCGDMNLSSTVDLADVPCFVNVLLGFDDCVVSCDTELGAPYPWDCNGNDVNDALDLKNETSEDCNHNFIPDECDISNETSTDLNANGIPDECEPDCNGNSIPDDVDIAEETSDDVNANGIPDECEPDCNNNDVPDDADISGYMTGETPVPPVSADCNANGIPDECELDCNGNDIPDDCDIDGWMDGETPVAPVSYDCNENGIPDECDMSRSIFTSFDCNMNGIPDECDIAGYMTGETPVPPVSEDCNGNGLLDECEIAWHIVADTNENGIPDPCEEEYRSMTGETPVPQEGEGEGEGSGETEGEGAGGGESSPSAEAYAELVDWMLEQEWGPNASTTPAEQFAAFAEKCVELGLPIQSPQLGPVGP